MDSLGEVEIPELLMLVRSELRTVQSSLDFEVRPPFCSILIAWRCEYVCCIQGWQLQGNICE